MKRGLAGGLAASFIESKLTPLVIAASILIGAGAVWLLPREEEPQIVVPMIDVFVEMPGATPREVERRVTTPMEKLLWEIPGVEYIYSTSSPGVSMAVVRFKVGEDEEDALVRLNEKLQANADRMPPGAIGPLVKPRSIDDVPVLAMTLSSARLPVTYDHFALRRIAAELQTEIKQVANVSEVTIIGGARRQLRVQLDPARLAAHGLSPSHVAAVLQQANQQSSSGAFATSDREVLVKTGGFLRDADDARRIVIAAANERPIYLGDVATIVDGPEEANDYVFASAGESIRPAVTIAVSKRKGANATELTRLVEEKVHRLRGIIIPAEVDAAVTRNYGETAAEKSNELLLHMLLAVFSVTLLIGFTLGWRESGIVAVAIPVTLALTLAVFQLFGYTLNRVTLFALIFSIGILVDDAIVVVENVERNIEEGLTPLAAAHQAMREVSGPIIAIALVLCAVFVPMAFLSGVTGQFYKQFAVTIAISTVISAVNSLTLSPALAARLLKPHGAAPDAPTRVIDRLFGWLFRPFNRFFRRSSERYQGTVGRSLGRRGRVFAVYAVLLVATAGVFSWVPRGFIPIQDKLYLIAGVKMPEGASIERTDAALKKIAATAMSIEGVEHEVAVPGLTPLQFTNTPNSGVVFFPLKPFGQRHNSAKEINDQLNAKIAGIQEGFAFSLLPPPILGLGNGSGYSLFVQDRANLGYGALQGAVQGFQGAVSQTPGMGFPISSYQANVPQLDAEVDRDKAKAQGVPLTELFDTLQTYLGSAYVNDFNLFGRTWQVIAQADGRFRDGVEDIGNLRTRNARGEMVPIGSMVTVKQTYGPDPVIRFNGYPAADLLGEADPRVLSSAQAMATVGELASHVLPNGMGFEWSDLSYQEATQGKAALVVFPLAVLLAFLVLAALYESWTLPLAVILIVPMTLLSALLGVKLTGGDNNVFVQVGLVVLMGLACKNAILIVEFARELELQGKGIVEAALEACRLRLRPIVMTSIAFIAGTIPLVLSHGAGAEVRSATGVTVFAGMIGVTMFGLFLTPVFYVALRKLVARPLVSHAPQGPVVVAPQ